MERKISVAAVGDNCMDVYEASQAAYPGGNPVNVAVYIKRLGGEASYTGAVGTDTYGRRMIQAIAGKGVDVSHIKVLGGSTAVTHVELADGDRVLGDYEEGVLVDFKLDEEDIAFLCSHDLVVTGIWGMIEDDLPEIRKQNVPIAFDFANKFAEPKVNAVVPFVDYAFFSLDEESGEDFKKAFTELGCKKQGSIDDNLREYMKAIQKRGPRVVIVTLGERGSIAWDGGWFYEYGIVSCKVVDTMGAGDSFIAGFLYGIQKGIDIASAMEVGARNSSETIGYSGAW